MKTPQVPEECSNPSPIASVSYPSLGSYYSARPARPRLGKLARRLAASSPSADDAEHFERLKMVTGNLRGHRSFPSPDGTLFTANMVHKLLVFLVKDYSADAVAFYLDKGYTNLGGGVAVVRSDRAGCGYEISFGDPYPIIKWNRTRVKLKASGARFGGRRPFTLIVDRSEPWTHAEKIELELVATELNAMIAHGEQARFSGRWRSSWASVDQALKNDERLGTIVSASLRQLKGALAADYAWYLSASGSYACVDYACRNNGGSGSRVETSQIRRIPKKLLELVLASPHAFYARSLGAPLDLRVGGDVVDFLCVPVMSDDELAGLYLFGYRPERCLPAVSVFESLSVPESAADKFRYLTQRRFPNVWLEPIYRSRNTTVVPKKVAVLMPFMEEWSERIWIKILRPHLASLGLTAVRADDLYGRDVMEDIWSMILDAELVIADITSRNANVFYELGLAHTIGKPVILITQSTSDIPFDLNRYRHVIYEDNLDGYEKLTAGISGSVIDALKKSV